MFAPDLGLFFVTSIPESIAVVTNSHETNYTEITVSLPPPFPLTKHSDHKCRIMV